MNRKDESIRILVGKDNKKNFSDSYQLLKELKKEKDKETRVKLWNTIYMFSLISGKYFPSLDFLKENS